MKEPRLWKVHIQKLEDNYYFLIEDPKKGTVAFRERLKIPFASRERILRELVVC